MLYREREGEGERDRRRGGDRETRRQKDGETGRERGKEFQRKLMRRLEGAANEERRCAGPIQFHHFILIRADLLYFGFDSDI